MWYGLLMVAVFTLLSILMNVDHGVEGNIMDYDYGYDDHNVE